MMAALETTEKQVLGFLEKYSGTHKLSDISRMCGPNVREALSSLEDKKIIHYHIDSDSRFSGWQLSEKELEGYMPSLEGNTLPAQIAKFLKHTPKTKDQIIAHFEKLGYSSSTVRGRLSEMTRAKQLDKCNRIYRLLQKEDD